MAPFDIFYSSLSPGIDELGPLVKDSHLASVSLFGEWLVFVTTSFKAHCTSKPTIKACIGSCNPRNDPESLRGFRFPPAKCPQRSHQEDAPNFFSHLVSCPGTKTCELPQFVSSSKILISSHILTDKLIVLAFLVCSYLPSELEMFLFFFPPFFFLFETAFLF